MGQSDINNINGYFTVKKYMVLVVFILVMTGCGLDNYEEPQSRLTGKITYNDQAIPVKHGSIIFDLQQDAYPLSNTIDVFISQDGSFSAMLFDGTYRMVARNNNGPWLNDSQPVEFTVKGNTMIEFKVTPYYTLSDDHITCNGNLVTASCTVTKAGGENKLEDLALYVGKTTFVDDRDYNKIASVSIPAVEGNNNSFTLDITGISQDHPVLYARLGLKVSGVNERIYSQVVKIK